ncbi:hypothetical protein [Niabella hibiscisoli]|uniref:hypothetical protein n=1 Tax=Niabella hibiscisoli TaxID=1825928 RepID=UPI001F105D32|nr:hypothetical protein [Niabella hibiscisoli]MCH5719393.1 hypothetical protein [Niabella hibiscisoli]
MFFHFGIIALRSFLVSKNNIPNLKRGRRAENDIQFEEAIKCYEEALIELNRFRYYKNLKREIAQKVKLLYTVVNYNRNVGT